MQIALPITLHQNQEAIHNSPALNRVVKSGKRFGKTFLAIYTILKEAGKKQGMYWYVSPFYGQSKNIAWVEMRKLLPKEVIKRMVENELLIELVNGSSVRLIGADNPNTLRGPKLDGVVMDEAAYIDPYVWDNIIRGQLLSPNGGKTGWAFFISSPINPFEMVGKNKRDWYTDFFNEAVRKKQLGDPDWDAFHFTIYDNPTLQRSEIDKIKEGNTEIAWNIEYMAQESDMAGKVYPEFKPAQHVMECTPSGSSVLVRGHDWGIDHPTACLWVNVDDKNKRIYIEDEYAQAGFTIEESVNVIKKKTGDRPVSWDVCDPSMNKRNSQTKRTDKDEYARLGIPLFAGDNNNRGYNITKMFFKKDIIRIHPKCKTLITQLKNLQWTDDVQDDLPDVLRYVCVRIHDIMFKWSEDKPKGEPESPFKQKPYSLLDPLMFPKSIPSSGIQEQVRAY